MTDQESYEKLSAELNRLWGKYAMTENMKTCLREEGYAKGYKAGHDVGYQKGVQDGYEEGKLFANLPTGLIDEQGKPC